MRTILKIEKLNLNYAEHHVLKNIDLQIEENKITSIIGPSGCGKSTLLKCINNIIKENKEASLNGNIFFLDKNINVFKEDELRKNIGMVFQNSVCFPMSIQKNMEYALKYFGISRAKRKEIIKESLQTTGLHEEVKDMMNKSALKLSGGQQQRLCIARTLSVQPKILLLDEPCSALDVMNTKIIEGLLTSLKKNYTILIVTHNLSQAKRISDNVIFMNGGRVIEYGNCESVFNTPENIITKQYINGNFG